MVCIEKTSYARRACLRGRENPCQPGQAELALPRRQGERVERTKAREQGRKGGMRLLTALHLFSTRRTQVLPLGLSAPLCILPMTPSVFPLLIPSLCKITNQVDWIGALCPPHLGFGGHLCTIADYGRLPFLRGNSSCISPPFFLRFDAQILSLYLQTCISLQNFCDLMHRSIFPYS